jgi:ABC-2 type transport system permease protein
MLFLPPLIQLLIFGYSVNLDVENTVTAWMDMDRTPESRELREAFAASPYFEITAAPAQETEVHDLLDSSSVHAVVRVLPGFARNLQRDNTQGVQVLVDGTNSNTAGIIANYATRIVSTYAARVLQGRQNSRILARVVPGQGPVPQSLPSIKASSRVWFNPNLRSRDYFVPGIVVNIIALVTIMLTGMSIVREKEIGTMEQLMVTPIRPIELMLGKMLPFALVGLVDVALVTVAALLIFGIPFRGSALFVFGCSLAFLLTTLGVGLFISTISRTQQQALMSSFFFFMPAFMLSGFTFPIRNMPEPVQILTYLNPLRYFMQIVRGVFLKGIGWEILWPQTLALLAFGSLILGLSALRFRKRLD